MPCPFPFLNDTSSSYSFSLSSPIGMPVVAERLRARVLCPKGTEGRGRAVQLFNLSGGEKEERWMKGKGNMKMGQIGREGGRNIYANNLQLSGSTNKDTLKNKTLKYPPKTFLGVT